MSGKERNPNPNFLVRISSGGVGVFHVKGWGAKTSVCPSKPGETKLFLAVLIFAVGVECGENRENRGHLGREPGAFGIHLQRVPGEKRGLWDKNRGRTGGREFLCLVEVSDIFYFIFLLGEGEGGVRGARRCGGRFFIKNPRGGGALGGEGPRGREGVCGELGNFGWGAAKYFFSGPKCPASLKQETQLGT